MNEITTADGKKLNPAELIQRAMNGALELQEALEALQASTLEIKSGMKELYKKLSAVEVKVDYLAECVARHNPPPKKE
jgi:hypothetical protein